jgi:hypothetical protein
MEAIPTATVFALSWVGLNLLRLLDSTPNAEGFPGKEL